MSLALASYKLRFHDVHVRTVPSRDEAGCVFGGPGVDLRADDARTVLDDPALTGPFRAWLAAREPGVVLRSLSVDLASRRVLITLEPMNTEQRPRVVRIDPPQSEELILATAPLEAALVQACVVALRRRENHHSSGLLVTAARTPLVSRPVRAHSGSVTTVLIATDLTEHSEPALTRGRAHAEAIGADWAVCHVVPDVLRHHPLLPRADQNDLALGGDLTKMAADAVSQQVGRVLRASPDAYRVMIGIGNAEDEIVRFAEELGTPLIVIGGHPRHGVEKTLGHVAERVVRYAHASVLVARPSLANAKVLVATDFTDGSLPAVQFGALLIKKVLADATLLHTMQLPETRFASAVAALGGAWTPPSKKTVDELEALGKSLLAGLAKEHGYAHVEQLEGDPADLIVARAKALSVEMIVMGSRGRTGLARLFLGSTAEKVIRMSETSVLVAR